MFEIVVAEDVLSSVRSHDFDEADDPMGADRIDAIVALDRAIRAAQAEQAVQVAAMHDSRIKQVRLAREDPSLSVIGELGLARNISPSAAATHYGFAVGLARLPKTASVFAAGGISEQGAKLVVKESTGLTPVQCGLLDDLLAPRLTGTTARKAQSLARSYTINIDADAAYERAKANRLDRFVSLFSDRDGTAILQVRGPAEQLVATYKTLDAAAASAKAAGDPRTRGQVMFDEMILRATGQKTVNGTSIELGLVMSSRSLFGTEQLPAILAGYGPIPAGLAHDLVAAGHQAWIRRLFTDPATGSLVDCDPKRRRFTGPLRHLISTRDRTCRQPGCSCQISQYDHIRPFQNDGPTNLDNGQGLCTRSHTLKHLPGWNISGNGSGDIIWQTPTGHNYTSKPEPIIEYQSRPSKPPRPPGHLRQ